MILLKDFAATHNKKTDTLRKYISRHQDEFSGHTKQGKKGLEIDEVAQQLLESSFPPPVEVVAAPDAELQKKIMQLQDLVIQLQAHQATLQEKATLADSLQLLLEDRNAQLDELKAELKEERAATQAANEKVEELLRRTLWERIRNKM